MRTHIRVLSALIVALCFAHPVGAQGVLGSTVRRGSADSLYRAFAQFVRTGEFTFQRADSVRREVIFLAPKLTKERLIVRFVSRGDSTEISGQSADRGMVGTIASLDAVRQFLVALDSTAVRRDSTARPR